MDTALRTELEHLRRRVAELEAQLPGAQPVNGLPAQEKVPSIDILDSVGEACASLDSEWRYVYVNQQAVALARAPRSQLLGRVIWDVFPALKSTNAFENLQRSMRERVHTRYEDYFPPHDIWVEVDVYPAADGVTMLVRDITERKLSEQAMRRQARVLESMTEGVSISDESGTILYTNAAEDRIFGYEPGELTGQHVTVQNAYPPEENARLVGEVIQQLQTAGSWSGEWLNRKKDGTPFYTHARITALEVDGKKLWVCVQADVTEKKRAEEALRKSEAELQFVVNQAPAFIAYLNREFRYVRVNHLYEQWFGLSADEIRGKHIRDAFGDEYFTARRQMIERVLTGERVSFESRVRRPNGEERDMAVIYTPFRDDNGNVQGFLALLQDITERNKAEEALRESEQSHRFLAEGLPQIVWRATADNQLVYINSHWREYTGLTLEETQADGWINVIHPDDLTQTVETATKAVREGGAEYQAEYRLRRALDGSYRWHLGRARLILTADGTTQWVGTAIDIHDRRETEEALQRSEERIQQQLAELEHIYHTAPVGLNFFDTDLRYVRINERLAEINGVSVADHIGKRLIDILPEIGARIEQRYQQAIASGEPILDLEVTGRTRVASEKEHSYLVSLYPVKDSAGTVLGVTTVVQDITSLKGIENELAKLNRDLSERVQEFETLLNVIPLGIHVAHDPAGQFITLNRYFYELLGIEPGKNVSKSGPPEEVVAPFRVFRDGRELTAAELPLQKALLQGSEVRDEEIDVVLPDGREITLFGHAAPLFDVHGQVRGGLGALLDITGRKHAETERIELLTREQALRQQAEAALEQQRQVEQQLLLLVEASSALIASVESSQVLNTILALAKRFVGADAYAVWRSEQQGAVWKILADDGLSPEYGRILRNEAGSVRSAPPEPVALEDVEQSPMVSHRVGQYRAEGIRSMLTVPLRVNGQIEGTIVFYYRSRHRFSELEIRVAAGLANLAAAALGTSELYERQKELRRLAELAELRARLLADAGALLSSSLDYETTLARVSELAVPAFADWVSVDLLNEAGHSQRVAVKHIDPHKVALAYEFNKRYPPTEADPRTIAMRTGRSFLMEYLPDELLVKGAQDAEHLRAIRELGLTSFIVAPLVVRGRTLGIITFVSAESGRRFTAVDLTFAEQIASRAATAVENAQLYRSVRTSEERYRSLISATTSIVWTINPAGEFVEPQTSWEAYTGQSWEEHRGLGWANAIHAEDREAVKAVWFRCREDEQTYETEGRVWHAASGQYRYFVGRATPVRSGHGSIREWVGTVTDVHEKKKAEAELVATNEALLRSNRALEQFAFSASHDLQEPLRMVAIYSEMIRRKYSGKLDVTADEYIRHTVQGAKRMGMLVNDLLAYTQAATVSSQTVHPIDTTLALQQALQNLESAITESAAVIQYGELPLLPIQQVHMRQVFQNLVGNAIKYRSAMPPVIEVAATHRDGEWLFSVKDNGIGIDPQYREQIFGVFKRLHTAEAYAGTGIGLALCQRIVEQYGGRIWVESKLGEGATFYFALPG